MRSQLNRRVKKILEAGRAELLARIGATRQFGIEKHADPVEEARLDAERELALGTLATATRRFHDVEAALYRLEARTFGICLHCDSEIEAKRLAAVPWTPLCLQCQSGSEQEAGASRLLLEEFQHRAV